MERKAALRTFLRHGRGIQYVEHAEGHGDRLFAAACEPGLEGIVCQTQRGLSLGAGEDLDQSQKSEGTSCNPRHRWDVLKWI